MRAKSIRTLMTALALFAVLPARSQGLPQSRGPIQLPDAGDGKETVRGCLRGLP